MSPKEDPEGDRLGAASDDQDEQPPGQSGGRSHWLMLACCVPMLVFAVVLVAAGAPIGTLAIAIACTAMMGFMMLGMMRS